MRKIIAAVLALSIMLCGCSAVAFASDMEDDYVNSDTNVGAEIDDVDVVLGTATRVAGTDTADTSDDIWASLNKADGFNKPLVVAWGRSEEEVASALTAFNTESANGNLALGDAVVATATTLDDSDTTNDFSKKNNGTLA